MISKDKYNSIEEQELFEWINAEEKRVNDTVDMPNEERWSRLEELKLLYDISICDEEYGPCPEGVYLYKLKNGELYYNKRPINWNKRLDEFKFFEWIGAEFDRIEKVVNMSEEERHLRYCELNALRCLSQPYTIRYRISVAECYLDVINKNKNFYDKRPLYWNPASVLDEKKDGSITTLSRKRYLELKKALKCGLK